MEDFEKIDKKFIGDVINAAINKHISLDQANKFILDRMNIYRMGGARKESNINNFLMTIGSLLLGVLFGYILIFIFK